jgi:hypothetical protein
MCPILCLSKSEQKNDLDCLQDPADVKSRVIQFIISFLVTDDYTVIRQLLTVKGLFSCVICRVHFDTF